MSFGGKWEVFKNLIFKIPAFLMSSLLKLPSLETGLQLVGDLVLPSHCPSAKTVSQGGTWPGPLLAAGERSSLPWGRRAGRHAVSPTEPAPARPICAPCLSCCPAGNGLSKFWESINSQAIVTKYRSFTIAGHRASRGSNRSIPYTTHFRSPPIWPASLLAHAGYLWTHHAP